MGLGFVAGLRPIVWVLAPIARPLRRPGDGAVATWTFEIEGAPFTVYGSFAEACAKAKFYVRLYDTGESAVVLLETAGTCARWRRRLSNQ